MQYMTIGQMSRAWDVPLWRINYVIATRRIDHAFKAGGSLRMYDRAAVARIQRELGEITIRQFGRPTGPHPAVECRG